VTSVPASLRQSNHLDRRGVHSPKVEIHINHMRGARKFNGRPTRFKAGAFWQHLPEIAYERQERLALSRFGLDEVLTLIFGTSRKNFSNLRRPLVPTLL
jgi:hypothetical protein